MTRKILYTFLGLAAAVAAQECSTASLSGGFGYTLKGTVTSANNRPITNSEVGRLDFDGKGGITGVAAVTSGGSATVAEVKGDIQIGSDCTATGRLVYPGATVEFDLVVVNASSDFALVVRAGDATLSGTGSKVEAQGTCSASSISGTYGYQGEGVMGMDGKAFSLAEIGILTFDGRGGVKGTYSAISGGKSERQSFEGTYEMTDVCFGSFAYKLGDATYQSNFMSVAGNNQLVYSEAGPSWVVTGLAVRTTPR